MEPFDQNLSKQTFHMSYFVLTWVNAVKSISGALANVIYDAVSDVVESGVHWRSNFKLVLVC